MRSYLPLNALRAFESAARHLSFTRAADELCVTPTAISHQIRSLEEFLEAPLFERRNGRLTMTAAASAALDELSDGFNKLESAISPLCRRGKRQKITVAASPSFASLWLMPRLQRFCETAPDVDVSIAAVIAPRDFDEAAHDVSICSFEEHPNRKVDYLMDEQIMPVCSPDLLPSDFAGRRAAMARLPLIHDDKPYERFPTWRRYFEEIEVAVPDTTSGLHFNQSSLAIDAAMKGHGMLLGRSRLIAPALAEGRLALVLETAHPVAGHYYTVRQSGAVSKPVRTFLDWLASEVAIEDAAIAP
jgi:LysR family glycine cleavage system transcriptional activator